MRVIAVIDLEAGQVVRGLAGKREDYQPLRTGLFPSSQPLLVAQAFRRHFGVNQLYLADLDAIAGGFPALNVFKALQSEGFTLLVDAGLRQAEEAGPLMDAGVSCIIAGLETLAGPVALKGVLEQVGSQRLVFSLDLRNGKPLASSTAWRKNDPWEIAIECIQLGVRKLLVLDVARVGVNAGTGTETFCARLKNAYPEVEILAGGGVRGREDLEILRRSGVHGVLVASALHDGRLQREDLDALGDMGS